MILDARRRPREVPQMRRLACGKAVELGQPARQFRHGRDYCRAFGGERHLIVDGGYSISCRARSEDSEKQRQSYNSKHDHILLSISFEAYELCEGNRARSLEFDPFFSLD